MARKNINLEIKNIAHQAKKASMLLPNISSTLKNKALLVMAKELSRNTNKLMRVNELDINKARRARYASGFIDRLKLTSERIRGMINSLRKIAELPDPVGEIFEMDRRPNGLLVGKMRVPIGVIGIIYESRPNVTCDCIGLCLKSANAVILRGGKEAFNSNNAIYEILRKAALDCNIPQGAINFIQTTDRRAVDAILKLSSFVDLIIPRGGESLINTVVQKSQIPVIKHFKGVCHVYIDSEADLNMATEIAFNAKVQRPGVCNAMETLLVHQDVAARVLPGLGERLRRAGVEVRGCKLTRKIIKYAEAATLADWSSEYLSLILSVKVVKDANEAIQHINNYGTKHSDAIVTENYAQAMRFLQQVDAACVYVNASTRFTDGYEFGLGAEIGISTDKIHARGPMGTKELTTYKYIILGQGQVRK